MQLFTQDRIVRCCLIQLYGNLQPANAEPLSIEVLAGAIGKTLPSASVDLQILGSFQSVIEQESLLANILAAKYDLIGLSCPQGTYEIALTALHRIYKYSHPPYILLGNALPTSLPDVFLAHFPHVLIVRGWGEAAIVKLCQQIAEGCVQLERVPSLTYLDQSGEQKDTPIAAIEEIAIPSRMEPKRYFARIEASRGCHYNICTFCSRPPLAAEQPVWRRFESMTTIAQVHQLVAAGITTFTFTDEDFIGDDPQGALTLAQSLCSFTNLDFALSVRADNIINPYGSIEENGLRRRVFQTLRQAGLSLVFIGVESFAPSQLRRYGKGISPEHSIAAIRLLETLDIELELGLILFDPLLSAEELRVNVQTLQETGFWRYAGSLFSFLRPQVGTPYEKLLAKRHLLGALRQNTADYEAIYVDSSIGEIAQCCQQWNIAFKRFYMALRNVKRSEIGTSHFEQEIYRYRATQLDFLQMLLHCSREEVRSFLPSASLWYKKVVKIAQDIDLQLSSISEKTASEFFIYGDFASNYLMNITCFYLISRRMGIGVQLSNNLQNINIHADEILNEYRQGTKRNMLSFSIAVFLITAIVSVISLIFLIQKNENVAFLLLSTALSLFVSLLFTIFYTLVVDSSVRRSESRAQSLEIEDVKKTVSEEIHQSTQDISVKIEHRIQRMLEEEATRLVDNWPELLPKDYFPPSEDSNPRFLEKLGEAVTGAQHYMFRGATGRFVPKLLREHARTDLNCSILLIDPRATTAIQIYAINRHGTRSEQRLLKEFEADIQQEIYAAIVNLFDMRQRFRIEVRTCNDHLFHRSELVDDGAFVSFYVGDRKTLHPPAYFYTKGTFYYAAFRRDFQQSWDFHSEQFAMQASMGDDALEKFLITLGAGDDTTITQKISACRKKNAEQTQ